MKKYYFLGCLLPKLSLKAKPEISFFDMQNILKLNLSKKDMEKVEELRKYIDLKNLKALWLEKSIDSRGNLDEKGLDQVFLLEEFFEDFVFEFLKKYENREDRLKNFSFLLYDFMNFQSKKDGFLSFFFKMKKEIKLIILALRAFELRKDIKEEVKFFEKDFFLEDILSQRGEEGLEVSKKYEEVKKIFLEKRENPKKMHLKILEFIFNKIEEKMEKSLFGIDQILAYLTNLIIVEDFYFLDENRGKVIVDNLL